MLILLTGLILFLGGHLVTRARGFRDRLVAKLGEGGYRIGYSLVSALGLVLIVIGWTVAPFVAVWSPPGWTRHIPVTLMWPAFVLIVAAYLPGNIRAKLKHPMLVAVKLWAFGHLLANGDLKSILLFGAFLAWAVIARIGLKRQQRREGATEPRPGTWRNDVVALVIGTALYGLFGAFLHRLLIGVPAFGM